MYELIMKSLVTSLFLMSEKNQAIFFRKNMYFKVQFSDTERGKLNNVHLHSVTYNEFAGFCDRHKMCKVRMSKYSSVPGYSK